MLDTPEIPVNVDQKNKAEKPIEVTDRETLVSKKKPPKPPEHEINQTISLERTNQTELDDQDVQRYIERSQQRAESLLSLSGQAKEAQESKAQLEADLKPKESKEQELTENEQRLTEELNQKEATITSTLQEIETISGRIAQINDQIRDQEQILRQRLSLSPKERRDFRQRAELENEINRAIREESDLKREKAGLLADIEFLRQDAGLTGEEYRTKKAELEQKGKRVEEIDLDLEDNLLGLTREEFEENRSRWLKREFKYKDQEEVLIRQVTDLEGKVLPEGNGEKSQQRQREVADDLKTVKAELATHTPSSQELNRSVEISENKLEALNGYREALKTIDSDRKELERTESEIRRHANDLGIKSGETVNLRDITTRRTGLGDQLAAVIQEKESQQSQLDGITAESRQLESSRALCFEVIDKVDNVLRLDDRLEILEQMTDLTDKELTTLKQIRNQSSQLRAELRETKPPTDDFPRPPEYMDRNYLKIYQDELYQHGESLQQDLSIKLQEKQTIAIRIVEQEALEKKLQRDGASVNKLESLLKKRQELKDEITQAKTVADRQPKQMSLVEIGREIEKTELLLKQRRLQDELDSLTTLEGLKQELKDVRDKKRVLDLFYEKDKLLRECRELQNQLERREELSRKEERLQEVTTQLNAATKAKEVLEAQRKTLQESDEIDVLAEYQRRTGILDSPAAFLSLVDKAQNLLSQERERLVFKRQSLEERLRTLENEFEAQEERKAQNEKELERTRLEIAPVKKQIAELEESIAAWPAEQQAYSTRTESLFKTHEVAGETLETDRIKKILELQDYEKEYLFQMTMIGLQEARQEEITQSEETRTEKVYKHTLQAILEKNPFLGETYLEHDLPTLISASLLAEPEERMAMRNLILDFGKHWLEKNRGEVLGTNEAVLLRVEQAFPLLTRETLNPTTLVGSLLLQAEELETLGSDLDRFQIPEHRPTDTYQRTLSYEVDNPFQENQIVTGQPTTELTVGGLEKTGTLFIDAKGRKWILFEAKKPLDDTVLGWLEDETTAMSPLIGSELWSYVCMNRYFLPEFNREQTGLAMETKVVVDSIRPVAIIDWPGSYTPGKKQYEIMRRLDPDFAVTDYEEVLNDSVARKGDPITKRGLIMPFIEDFDQKLCCEVLGSDDLSSLEKVSVLLAATKFNLFMLQKGFVWKDQGAPKRGGVFDNYLVERLTDRTIRLRLADSHFRPCSISAVNSLVSKSLQPTTHEMLRFYTPFTEKKHFPTKDFWRQFTSGKALDEFSALRTILSTHAVDENPSIALQKGTLILEELQSRIRQVEDEELKANTLRNFSVTDEFLSELTPKAKTEIATGERGVHGFEKELRNLVGCLCASGELFEGASVRIAGKYLTNPSLEERYQCVLRTIQGLVGLDSKRPLEQILATALEEIFVAPRPKIEAILQKTREEHQNLELLFDSYKTMILEKRH